jgi:hypothetical protein
MFAGGNMCHVTFDHLIRAIEFQNKNKELTNYFYQTSWEWGRFFIENAIEKYDYLQEGQLYSIDKLFIMNNGFNEDNFIHPNVAYSELGKKAIKKVVEDNVALNKSLPSKVYLTRKGKGARAVSNECDLEDYFSQKGFLIYEVIESDVLEQLSIFYNADVVVSLHGAGLSNLIACKKETQVLEIFTGIGTLAYEKLSKSTGLDYFRVDIDYLPSTSALDMNDIELLDVKFPFINKSNSPNTLVEYSNKLSNKNNGFLKLISTKDIDLLKDLAISLEVDDFERAFKLMQLVYEARPSGPLIKKKIEEYKKRSKSHN